MNKRMKLADGSRWEGNAVVDRTGARSLCEQSGGTSPGWVLATSDEGEPGIWVTDALAVIDSAGLDRVRVVARNIRDLHNELWCDSTAIDYCSGMTPLIIELCQALDDESEDE